MRTISLCCVLVACGGSSGPATPVPPTISGVSPATGVWGTQVTITGTGFGVTQGTNRVVAGAAGANGFVIDTWSDTQITGRIAFPATGSIGVTNTGGTASTTFTTTMPWTPSAALDVAELAQEIVLSTGDVAALYNEFELTPEPTIAAFTGAVKGAYPMSTLVDPQDPTAPLVAAIVEADDHTPEVLATKPDGSVAAFTVSGGTLTETPTTLSGNVVAAARDATGLYAWIETETGIELAREGSAWTAGPVIATTYPPVAGAISSDGTLWLVVSEPGSDGTTSYPSVETIAETGSAFSALDRADMAYAGDITAATILVASDNVHALVTPTASGVTTPLPARLRTAAATWSNAAVPTGLASYGFFGATLGAVTNDSSSAMTTALLPDVSMSTSSQAIDVWPAQSAGFAVDGSGIAHPIVDDGNVAYALTSSM
ncbi:MAG TPA: IPT/TIG domain-containing protein [Kofleriaceae bacterium]|nr:IPT/TIG domain-containing protein [Kofleriaceae bacterium]